MNNSVYGKTLENIRNHKDIRLVTNRRSQSNYANKPNFYHCTIFDETLISIHMKREKLVLNKPIYLGFSILERSKQLLYEFHYNYIKYIMLPKLRHNKKNSETFNEQHNGFKTSSRHVSRMHFSSSVQ